MVDPHGDMQNGEASISTPAIVKDLHQPGLPSLIVGTLLDNLSHMVAYRRSSKNIGKMNLQSLLNKNSPQAHIWSRNWHAWCCRKSL
jgi:hypothetical protein